MKYFILASALICNLLVFAGGNTKKALKSYTLTGKVVDNVESLTGVKVMLDHEEVEVYTDFDGNFTIDNVLEGDHVISFSMVAYDDKEVKVNPRKDSNLKVELEAK